MVSSPPSRHFKLKFTSNQVSKKNQHLYEPNPEVMISSNKPPIKIKIKKEIRTIQEITSFIDDSLHSTTSIVNNLLKLVSKISSTTKNEYKKKLARVMIKFFNSRAITKEENKIHIRNLYEELELLLVELEEFDDLSIIRKKHAMFLIANGYIQQGRAMLLEQLSKKK